MKTPLVKFGTSGHRGIMGDGFTAEQVRAIALAISEYLFLESDKPEAIIGYDPRRGNDPNRGTGSWTQILCDTLIEQGISVHFCETYTPTPVISHRITTFGLDGGIILTASHNPPGYNGIKFNPKNGAPAPESITKKIEITANKILDGSIIAHPRNPGQFDTIDPVPEFADGLVRKINQVLDTFRIEFDEMSVVVDTFHGACANTWTALFKSLGLTQFALLNKAPLPDFGGLEPNPTKPENVTQLGERVRELNAHMGFANDPDGDRHVVVDENGDALLPEEIAGIITLFLVERGIPVYGIASTVASSQLLNQICLKHRFSYAETPVGFKYFAPVFEAAKQSNEIGIGVESSGGFSTSFHTYEKCGFLPCVLLLYICKILSKPLSEVKDMYLSEFGTFSFKETEFKFNSNDKEKLKMFLETARSLDLSEFYSKKILSLNKLDGLKLNFEDNSWALIRLSGTEPVARIYAESSNDAQTMDLLAGTEELLQKKANIKAES